MDNRQPSTKLGQMMARLREASSGGNAGDCLEPMSGQTRQVEGLRSQAQFGDLAMVIDEPVAFGGTGMAPNPAEAMLAALGASIEVTIRCYADLMGIKVASIGVDLSGALNNRGFFGLDASVRAGFPRIGAIVRIVSEEDPEAVGELLEIAARCCPVLDNIRQPTDVALSLDLVRPHAA